MGHLLKEEWKEFVPEFKTTKRYFVSNHGNIKTVRISKEGKKVERLLKGSIIDGYQYLGFAREENGKRKAYHYSFHYLVGLLFLNKEDRHTNVVHLDYNRSNNIVTNLKWVTYLQMLEHSKKSPNVIAAKKKLVEFNRKRDGHKLTAKDVIRLKKKLFDPNRKTKNKAIAKEFGISEMQLYRIKSGENWSHVKVEIEGETY